VNAISTVAGNGQAGYSGDGGLATAATIQNPSAIILDASTSDVYFIDGQNFRVRKITKTTGFISTIAGTGLNGYSGDGGLATAAQISTAIGIALEPSSGNIYIADSGNYRIRMITKSTGFISTVAGTGVSGFSGDGGLATLAQISYSTDIAIHASAGLLYIADVGTSVIRMITLSTGVITTVAGKAFSKGYSGDGSAATSATLASPSSVDVNPSTGDVYIADSGNVVIRMVTKSSGIITTIAGTGVAGYSGDGGPATASQITFSSAVRVDPSTSDVYIDDTDNCCIRLISKKTGLISTVAGSFMGGCGYNGDGMLATSALLLYPNSLAINTGIGAFYISDSGNNRIRSVFEKVSVPSVTSKPSASPATPRPTRTPAPTGPTAPPTTKPSGPSSNPTYRPTGPTAVPTGPTAKPNTSPINPGTCPLLPK
jgi:trimeric autotransporter adhesin